jgi:protein-S-isoprenylcysteine O-methyltransferase Ste14
MPRNTREYIPTILNLLSALFVFVVSFFINVRLPVSKEVAKLPGILLVALGMALAVWATVYIREAILGEVEPRLQILVKEGPYRFIRHPVYLGIAVALTGVVVTLRSWLGLISIVILFLPSEVYRASLEEKALALRFGQEWKNYARKTGFFLPKIQRR